MTSAYRIEPVGIISTPFKQKFAIPRQPNLADARGQIRFGAAYTNPQAFKELQNYSHLWLLFIFHETVKRGWKPTVKAPRLGGNATMGVFASRSTHRPNGIGMSVVKNAGVSQCDGITQLNVSGVDLLDGTPIVDVKPYIGYADSYPAAEDGLTQFAPIPNRKVCFSPLANAQVEAAAERHNDAKALITAVLKQDPRPAYRQHQNDDAKVYKVKLYDFDVAWQVSDGDIHVLELV